MFWFWFHYSLFFDTIFFVHHLNKLKGKNHFKTEFLDICKWTKKERFVKNKTTTFHFLMQSFWLWKKINSFRKNTIDWSTWFFWFYFSTNRNYNYSMKSIGLVMGHRLPSQSAVFAEKSVSVSLKLNHMYSQSIWSWKWHIHKSKPEPLKIALFSAPCCNFFWFIHIIKSLKR